MGHGTQRGSALTGRPALSQCLSGRGLPARMTHGRDTGCPCRTRTVEALLAILGGAVGKGDGVRPADPVSGGWRSHLPPQGSGFYVKTEECTHLSLGYGGHEVSQEHLPPTSHTLRCPSEPCPVTASRISAWTFPKTF